MRNLIGLCCVLPACVLLAVAAPAAAQMSVTTIGATDASACYTNARDDFSRDTGPCTRALGDSATNRGDRKKTLVNRGVILNRAGELNAAIDDFNTALDLDDSLGEAFLNRGNSYYLMRQYDEALADYERSLELEVSKPWAAWYNIGLVHDAQKEPVKAREAYKEALRINPSFSEAKRKLEERN